MKLAAEIQVKKETPIMKNISTEIEPEFQENNVKNKLKRQTIPIKNIMDRAAIIDSPAPESDASVKSLGIFLQIDQVYLTLPH